MGKTQEINSISLSKVNDYIKKYDRMLSDFSVKLTELKEIICDYHSKHRNEYVEYFPNAFALKVKLSIRGTVFNVVIWDFKNGDNHMNLLYPTIENDGSITINVQINNHFMSKQFISIILDRNYRAELKGIALKRFVEIFDYDEQRSILDSFKSDVEDITLFYGNMLDKDREYSFTNLCDKYLGEESKIDTICLMFVLYYKEREEYVRRHHMLDYFDVEE